MKSKLCDSDRNTRRNSTNCGFCLQSAPPLSLQQYARAFATTSDRKQWRPPGIYRQPVLRAYLSPEIRAKPEVPKVTPWIYSYRRKYSIPTYSLKDFKEIKPASPEPIWKPPGCYEAKRPTSLSPEKRWQPRIHEPVWQPPGRIQYRPVPYFDPPSLRWSLQKLVNSMGYKNGSSLYI